MMVEINRNKKKSKKTKWNQKEKIKELDLSGWGPSSTDDKHVKSARRQKTKSEN